MYGHRMLGDTLSDGSHVVARSGFMPSSIPQGGFSMQGAAAASPEALQRQADFASLQRGEFAGDINQLMSSMQQDIVNLQRGITSGMTAFPTRQNLEAPASRLIPTETPLRNLLPRVPGAGVASSWKQITSLGGGWGTGYDQPGGGSAKQLFYAEGGAPVERNTVYADKTASYKLMGTLGSVTNFAAAAGANYQADVLGVERQNQLSNLMLNEEFALLWGDKSATAVPWGDGSNALSFDGMMTLTATANGTPAAQVQTAVGTLTTAHLDAQLTRIWKQGGRGLYMIMNTQEITSLNKLLTASGAIQRIQIVDQGSATMGIRVAKYIHPISGEDVDIYVSLFQTAGDIFYGARQLPDGRPVADVEVLPQVPVELAPEKPQVIQGYVVTELARSLTAPDVNPFMISVYEVLRLKSALHVAKSSGVTAA